MIETQRTHTPSAPAETNAYRTLHVAPSAPFELIEQAYWVLVTRARRERSGELRLGQLNDAYATLINPDRRTAYDLEHGLTKLRTRPRVEAPKRPIFGRKAKATTKLTHYQLLDVDGDASAEIVDLAYAHRKTKLRGGDARAVNERLLIEEAYQTLGHDERRAVYDQRVMGRHGPSAPPPSAPRTGTPATTIIRVEPEAPPAAAAPAPVPSIPSTPPPAHDPAPAAAAVVATAAAVSVAEPREGLGARFRKAFARTPVEGETAVKPDRQQQRELADEARRKELEAEHLRLAALGMTATRPAFSESEAEPHWPAGVRAQFRFTSGPQAGQSIPLTENSLILGASDAADVRLVNPDGMIGAGHVRVWRREDEFILHQLDSFSTTFVNGERLDLRLAILEAGDEIRIGPHTLVFDLASEEPAPVE